MGYRTIKSKVTKRFSPKPKPKSRTRRSRSNDSIVVAFKTPAADTIEEEHKNIFNRARLKWSKAKEQLKPLKSRLIAQWRRLSPRRHHVVDMPPVRPRLKSKERQALDDILPARPRLKSKERQALDDILPVRPKRKSQSKRLK